MSTNCIDRIKRAVCKEFGLYKPEIESHQREKRVAVPRMVGMALAKRLTGFSLGYVARQFGNRNHSTVFRACKRIDPYVVAAVQVLPQKAAPEQWVRAVQSVMELSE